MPGAAAAGPGARGRQALALSLLCLLLLSQPPGAAPAPHPAQAPPPSRQRRMTPLWRGSPLRPLGATCRRNSECITTLCRKNRCLPRTATA